MLPRPFLIAFGGTVLVLLLGVLLIVVWPGAPEPAATAPPSPSPTPTPAPAAQATGPTGLITDAPATAQEAVVGDCYLLSTRTPTWGMAHVRFVDCATPHHGQLVSSVPLRDPAPIDPDLVPAEDPAGSAAADFSLEDCVLTVWTGYVDVPDAGPALYVPPNLLTGGIADQVLCALETAEPRAGSLLG